MEKSTDQTARFIESLRKSRSIVGEQTATEYEAELLAFIDHAEQLEQGRAEREVDPEYQAALTAMVQRLGGKSPIR